MYLTTHFEHIPANLLAHELRAAVGSEAEKMIDRALTEDWTLDAERIACRCGIVWAPRTGCCPGRRPPPATDEWLPHADWVELDGIGHAPQLDVPLETAQLILGFTA